MLNLIVYFNFVFASVYYLGQSKFVQKYTVDQSTGKSSDIGKFFFGIILLFLLLAPVIVVNDLDWSRSISISFSIGFLFELIIKPKKKHYLSIILLVLSSYSLIKAAYTISALELFCVVLIAFLVDLLQNYIGKYLSRSNNYIICLINYKYSSSINAKKSITASIFSIILLTLAVYLLNKIFPITDHVFKNFSDITLVIITFFISLFSVLGDLIFSLLKRILNIADYFPTLASFGGVCDRADSWAFAFIPLHIYMLFV
jgi:phosphatidate cytidylyltransferase